MPGPLPTGNARRRNSPTIATTQLPASGRTEPVPEPPAAYELGRAGYAWWRWAWSLPQAAAWDDGALYAVARRATLEDSIAIHQEFEGPALEDLLMGADEEAVRAVDWAIGHLKGLATGVIAIKREARELDKRLGLDPKAMAELRWEIVDDEPAAPVAAAPTDEKLPANVRRIRAVDPALSASA